MNSALKDNLNKNEVALTNSTYYPTSYMYRSGQVVYLRCAGMPLKEIPADSEFVISTGIPEKYRPIGDFIFYPTVTIYGIVVRVSITADGKVTYKPPVKLSTNVGINMHIMYFTGKSNTFKLKSRS